MFGIIVKRAGWNKRAEWQKNSELLIEQAENERAGWKKNLKIISKHALLLGTSEYVLYVHI